MVSIGSQGTLVTRKVVGCNLFLCFSVPKWETKLDFTAVMVPLWEGFCLPRLNLVLPSCDVLSSNTRKS